MDSASSFAKKTILITGGNGGLGKALANKLLKKGNTVIVTSRSFNFSEFKNSEENSLIPQYMDVTIEDSVKNLFSWMKSLNIKINVLINNAGVGIFKPLIETTLAEWNAIILTNLTGAFLCSKEAYISMKANGGGRIINMGSIAEKIPLPLNTAYGASKSGLKGLSAILNEEGKLDKIRVTHVTLGATHTDMWNRREGFAKKDMLNVESVADYLSDIALLPLDIRIDNVEILPEKGVL